MKTKTQSLKRIVTMMLAFLLVLGSVMTSTVDVEAATKKPTKITLNTTKATLTVGESTTIKVKSVKPSNASKKVTFKTSNKKIATVNSKGKVTAKKAGTVTITVTSSVNKKVKATCKITVKPKAKSIVVSSAVKNTVSVRKGKTLTLKPSLAPSGAVSKGYTYKSSNTKVVTVDKKGKIKAKKAGKATITIKATGTKLTKKITVIVPKTVVKSVKLNKTSAALTKGQTLTLKATVNPSKATTKLVSWSSSKESVATVDANGKITAKKAGTATITVKTLDGGKTAKCKVTVTVPVTSVKLNASSANIKVGDSYTLKATIAPSDATDKTVTWTSSNTKVATVSGGVVKGVAAGTATITATSANGKKATCTVTVKAKTVDVTSVTLNKTSASLVEGKTLTLTATVAPSNATNKTLTWSTSNAKVATVSNGVVTAVSEGTATITATSTNGKKATCTVTVTAKEKSAYVSYGENDFKYVLDKDAASYKASYKDGTTFTLTSEVVANDVAKFKSNYASKTLTNDVLVDEFHNLTVDDVKANSEIVGLLFVEAGDVVSVTNTDDENVKYVTVSYGSRTKTAKLTLTVEDESLALKVVSSGKTVNITDIKASSGSSSNVVTANVTSSGKTVAVKAEVMKNGSAAYLYRAVNGSLIKAASYTETSDAYEFYVNGTYYSEALDLFGVDESNGVKAATVLNCY